MKISTNIRFPSGDKNYYINQLQKFADKFDDTKIKAVEFGKQDTRGTESITLVDHKHCVPHQKHFANKWEMLGFIVGYNNGSKSNHCEFEHFTNTVDLNKELIGAVKRLTSWIEIMVREGGSDLVHSTQPETFCLNDIRELISKVEGK